MRPRVVLDTSALLGPQRHELVFLASERASLHDGVEFVSHCRIDAPSYRVGDQAGLSRDVYCQRINQLIELLSQIAVLVDYTRLEGGNYREWLKDLDDEPLLATALVGRAIYVVSHNTSDFPPGGVYAGIHYLTPAAFLDMLYRDHPPRAGRREGEQPQRLP